MTTTAEAAPTLLLHEDNMHDHIQSVLRSLGREACEDMGIQWTNLQEVPVPGIHRLFVLDETVQPGGSFKYNGMAVAVREALRRNPDLELFTIGSAGNASSGLAATREIFGVGVEVYAPTTINPIKRAANERYGAVVHADYEDVIDAGRAAQNVAAVDPHTRFAMHAFNNPDAIAGQALVGTRIVEGIKAQRLTGRVEVLVQRGGGSLLTGVASVIYEAKERGELKNAEVVVREVRPRRIDGDKLDPRYDGLFVEEPGLYAANIVNSPDFIQPGTIEITPADTGRAANLLFPTIRHILELSGLAGAAGYVHERASASEPTTYITVATGANTARGAYEDISRGAVLEDQRNRIVPPVTDNVEIQDKEGDVQNQRPYRVPL